MQSLVVIYTFMYLSLSIMKCIHGCISVKTLEGEPSVLDTVSYFIILPVSDIYFSSMAVSLSRRFKNLALPFKDLAVAEKEIEQDYGCFPPCTNIFTERARL